MKASVKNSQDTKWVFIKKGTCSRTLFYILNREFDNPLEKEEIAADLLAGGILQQGYQCGLLFGAVLGVGAEASRRSDDRGKAISLAITTTQKVIESFVNRAKSADCEDITKTDFKNKLGLAKYFVTGKFVSCYKLADKWAPEAINTAIEGLSQDQTNLPEHTISCASEVVKKMGASDEEMLMVAGFAGGLGLSGNACGALSAAIWMNSLNWSKANDGKGYPSSEAEKILEAFFNVTDYEFLCSNISGKCFKSIDDHTEFIKSGGCDKLINVLAQS